MFSVFFVSLILFVFSINVNDDLKIYFDLNGDEKATSDEVSVFFDRFYEEKNRSYRFISF